MLFSIITVSQNNLNGLQRTWTSLAGQQFEDFEWIVVDGASIDGSPEWLGVSRANWITEPDNSVYDAMNKGLERAEGEYLLFLNAGDRLADVATLKRLAKAVNGSEIRPDFIYGDSFEERPKEPPAYKRARPHNLIGWGMFTHHQAMLYRYALIGGLRFDNTYRIAADYKFTALFLRHANASYCPFPVCIFEAGGLSQRRVALGRLEQFQVRRELGMCNPAANRMIRFLQIINMMLRRLAPALYWKLKSSKPGA